MKYAFFILLLCCFKIGKSNRIDILKTDDNVVRFILEIDKTMQQDQGRWPVSLLSKQELQDATKDTVTAAWKKADLNDDGKTDLIAYIRYYGVIAVMDIGEGKYKAARIKSFPKVPALSIAKIDGHTVLLTDKADYCDDDAATKKADIHLPTQLIYQFGQFVEYNKDPAHYQIASVTIYTGLCALGRCPSYKLTVEPNGNARYVAGSLMPVQGVFTGQLTAHQTNQIIGLMNYMRVKDMQDRYQPGCVLDGGGWALAVKFKDGSTKNIMDFNNGGTFGLEATYPIMNELAKTQTWKQIK